MLAFDLKKEEKFDPKHHVEKILGKAGEGDVTVACWEPGQTSPYHCHPNAVELYFCYEGGGTMTTPDRDGRGEARLVRRPPARRAPRVEDGAGTHPPLPRPLRRRILRPHQILGQQPGLAAEAGRCRVFQGEIGRSHSMASVTIDENRARHIFRDAEGHFAEDTPENRRALISAVGNPENFLRDGSFRKRMVG